VLRITVTTSDKKVVLKLEGRLVGPWVDELRKTVLLTTDAWSQPLEIDVFGLTYADDDGERGLCWFHEMGARFVGKGPFPEYLFDRLKIPLSRQEAIHQLLKTPAESRTTQTLSKRTRPRRDQ
jgi:hypothetical protein